MDEGLITVSKAAEILNCHPETVRRLERRGLLIAKRDYRRFRIFDINDVLQLKKERERLLDD